MSEWRPEEGWEEQATERLRGLDFDAMHASLETSEYYRNIYEAGADAMLVALRERAFIILPDQTLIYPTKFHTERGCADGCLTFIPNSANTDWPLVEKVEWVEGDSDFVAARTGMPNSEARKRMEAA